MPSTVLSDVQYDAMRQVLVVTFRPTGRRYAYAGVPPETSDLLRRAFARGSFFNRHIRGRYPATLLNEIADERSEASAPPTVAASYRPTVTRG